MNPLRRAFINASDLAYRALIRPLTFQQSAQDAHHRVMEMLRRLDNTPLIPTTFAAIHRLSAEIQPVEVGGVHLPQPMILAAGFIKGDGFADETTALKAVSQGHNIIPGWRAMPALVGAAEFGSFTRWPRSGNSGTVIWRDTTSQSTQNRVGLKNPGALASAAFLSAGRTALPVHFGINIAASPSVDDLAQECNEMAEAISFFLEKAVFPKWFTLNLSCPNTDDDPKGNQTETRARRLCEAAIACIQHTNLSIPLWVKVSPDLSEEQYHILMGVFATAGVRAIVATNTLPHPRPDNPEHTGGVSGGKLYLAALKTAQVLAETKSRHGYSVDIVGCGGVLNGVSYQAYRSLGVEAMQYWSALVYRGPLAAAIIAQEAQFNEENSEHGHRQSSGQRTA